MDKILFFMGQSCSPEAIKSKLYSQFIHNFPDIDNVIANWIYILKLNSKINQSRNKIYTSLKELLSLHTVDFFENNYLREDTNSSYLFVFPRTGTRTAWSSKAQDILKTCGFTDIINLERGVAYKITHVNSQKLQKEFFFETFKNKDSYLQKTTFINGLYDRMVEDLFINELPKNFFSSELPSTLKLTDLSKKNGLFQLKKTNENLGLALSEIELKNLYQYFSSEKRNPSDAELMMFGQVNSEHCRHKIFNSEFIIDGESQRESLFEMIKSTHKKTPDGTILAYSDNAAIIEGNSVELIDSFSPFTNTYKTRLQKVHTVFKAETHNHPTAVCPFPGAATGVGGEIRDESATGIGGKSKAGFSGYSVSSLDFTNKSHRPSRQSSPIEIMIKAPLGTANYNNEFGRPHLFGYFRAFEFNENGIHWGYHKPIMLTGGIGIVSDCNIRKKNIKAGDILIVLGGPSLKIGVGGGSASSMNAGENDEALDFNSVQRGNPEIQKRAQEVINSCISMDEQNPILSIHDVGAGGLANAVPEILFSAGVGGEVNLNSIDVADPSMSPAEVWCNESQERFVICISRSSLSVFKKICVREKCPFSVIAKVTKQSRLVVTNSETNGSISSKPIDISLDFLLNSGIKNKRSVDSNIFKSSEDLDFGDMVLEECIDKVLSHPTVGSKSFLITISDRTVGGLTARDQMVGPFQTPVSDNAIVLWDFKNYNGQVFSVGERSPIAVKNPAAASRMALGETITNILSVPIRSFKDIKLCANWMAACGENGQDYSLYMAVKALAKEICPELDLSIPVGKDSLSMKTQWREKNRVNSVISPVSLNLSAVAKTTDARKAWEPTLNTDIEDSILIYVDLSDGSKRLGGSVLSFIHEKFGGEPPDLTNTELIKSFFSYINELHDSTHIEVNALKRDKEKILNTNLVLAYHDISDGGLITTLCEMSFAARVGLTINIDLLTIDAHAEDWGAFNIRPAQVQQQRNELTFKALFNEELGVVIQISKSQRKNILDIFRKNNLGKFVFEIGSLNDRDEIEIYRDAKCIYKKPRALLQRAWSDNSFKISHLRDNSECIREDEKSLNNNKSLINSIQVPKILHEMLSNQTVKLEDKVESFSIVGVKKPKIAILREQGINGHIEMAAAFIEAGFETWDIHMTDIVSKRINLSGFVGLAVSGGFSFGDVFGAGKGWAQSILLNKHLKNEFSKFFNDKNKFTFGVCNGCQFLTELQEILPGDEIWPKFKENRSYRFESRQSFVEILESDSIFLNNMAGLKIPIIISHGQGRVEKFNSKDCKVVKPVMRFVNFNGNVTENYPENPNGSHQGLTGFTSSDGRIAALMPHPERCFRNIQFSWYPKRWNSYGDSSPWIQIFKNAFSWVNSK